MGDHLIAAWSRVQPRIALVLVRRSCMLACMEFRKLWVSFTRGVSSTHLIGVGLIVHRVDASATC